MVAHYLSILLSFRSLFYLSIFLYLVNIDPLCYSLVSIYSVAGSPTQPSWPSVAGSPTQPSWPSVAGPPTQPS